MNMNGRQMNVSVGHMRQLGARLSPAGEEEEGERMKKRREGKHTHWKFSLDIHQVWTLPCGTLFNSWIFSRRSVISNVTNCQIKILAGLEIPENLIKKCEIGV